MKKSTIAELKRQAREIEKQNLPLRRVSSRKRCKNLALENAILDDYRIDAKALGSMRSRDRRHVLRRIEREFARLGTIESCVENGIRFARDSKQVKHSHPFGIEKYKHSKFDNRRLRVCGQKQPSRD